MSMRFDHVSPGDGCRLSGLQEISFTGAGIPPIRLGVHQSQIVASDSEILEGLNSSSPDIQHGLTVCLRAHSRENALFDQSGDCEETRRDSYGTALPMELWGDPLPHVLRGNLI